MQFSQEELLFQCNWESEIDTYIYIYGIWLTPLSKVTFEVYINKYELILLI